MNNIFSALIHRRNTGVIWEFVLWCILCFEALFAMIAAILSGSKATWIVLMVFIIGLAVLMAFRLTPIALLYSVGVFYVITLIVDFVCYRSGSVMEIFLFVLLFLLGLAALACSFVHNFSRFDLDKVVMILVITDSVFTMILQIIFYMNRRSLLNGIADQLGLGFLTGQEENPIYARYWVGTICFWILLVVIDLYYILFVLGVIDNEWNKIIRRSSTPRPRRGPAQIGVPAGIQGVSGQWAGRVVYMDGRDLIIGSDQSAGATLVIHDTYVSRWHCALRYVPGGNGFYEIYDRSTNGVYLSNGSRLQQNVWNRLQRGTVICIGGMGQRLQLL